MQYLVLSFSQPAGECNCWNRLPEQCRKLGINPVRAFSVYHREGVDLNDDGVITLEETVEKPKLYFPVGDNPMDKMMMMAGWAIGQCQATYEFAELEISIPGVTSPV